MQINELQQALLFRLAPDAIGPPGFDSHAPDKSSARPSGIAGLFDQLGKQSAQFFSARVDICAHKVTCRFRPAKFAAGVTVMYITHGSR
jgi:hypothetical protein